MATCRTLPSLPLETIQMIVAELWSQTQTTDERWDLYDSLRATHPLMHELLVLVAVRRPCYEFRASRKDIELCRIISKQAAYFRASARDGLKHKSLRDADTVTQVTHILLDITPPDELECPVSWRVRPRWEEFMNVVQDVVPVCSSLTVFSAKHLSRIAAHLALGSLHSFSALTHLYLHYVHYHHAVWCQDSTNLDPIPAVPSVQFLRVKHYLECNCNMPQCLRRTFLRGFPNVRHLHLEYPTILKHLDTPPSLQIVTLEALLMPAAQGRAPTSSVVGYNLTAALRRGFLQSSQKQTVPPPTIVIQTRFAEPFGIQQAQAACAEYGVVLRTEIE